jgi:hypothetical protein
MLIFLPIPTWEHIAGAQRKWVSVLCGHFLPLVLLTCAAEGWGLVKWGKPRGKLDHRVLFTPGEAVVYEVAVALLFVAVVFILARQVKALGDTFHGRNSFGQAFAVAGYGMSPILLLRFLDMLPAVSPWITWGIGVTLAAATLYHGLPLILRPDPPHALGLYLMTCLLLVLVTGLARFVTAWYLQGRFVKVDAWVGAIAERLPF